MFMRKRKVEEDSSGGVPAWMMTFSDCMTLLLTFFVLLLSFSAFDRASLMPLKGAFKCRGEPTAFNYKQTIDDSVNEEVQPQFDKTDKGAAKPTDSENKITENPKIPDPIVDTEAYRDERVFYIASTRLFIGKGSVLTQKGKEYLEIIAAFMQRVPCKVIIGEIKPDDGSQAMQAGATDTGLRRSCVILRLLTEDYGLASERFCIAPTGTSAPYRFGGGAVMQITLLAKDLTQ